MSHVRMPLPLGAFHKAWVHGMSIVNVVGCFRSAGVYPVDKRIALAQLSNAISSPSRETATPYVPFTTPRQGTVGTPTRPTEPLEHATFSSSEVKCFQARLKESHDSRYALWLKTFHLRAKTSHEGVLEVILKCPMPPA